MTRRSGTLTAVPDDPRSPRQALLDAVLDHIEVHGTHELTLRGVAEAVGTSHRMLSYHFGSREGLLVAVTQAVEQRQRDALGELMAASELPPLEVMRVMAERLVDPTLWPQERLFFDLYARALSGRPDAEPFLDGIVEDWVEPVAKLFARLGYAPAQASVEARLAIAVTRGLLLDLLAGGDRALIERAMSTFIDRYRPDSDAADGRLDRG